MNLSPEDMFLQRRLSGIARQLNGIIKNFDDFRVDHPTVIAPNVIDAIVGNLKDDMNVVMREMNMISSPHKKKLQERRHACRNCQKVFMQPLVAGICDECRGLGITTIELPPIRTEFKEDEEKKAEETKTEETKPEEPTKEEITDSEESSKPLDLASLPMIGGSESSDPFKAGFFKRPESETEPDQS